MIRTDRMANAMYCIHLILVQLRFMALTNEPANKIATLADAAELLPKLIVTDVDDTETFKMMLKGIAEIDAEFLRILYAFDEQPLQPTW